MFFLMQNIRYLIGYRIFVSVAQTYDFSVIPQKDSTLSVGQKVL